MFYKTYLNLLKFHVLQNILKLKFHVSQKIFKIFVIFFPQIFVISKSFFKKSKRIWAAHVHLVLSIGLWAHLGIIHLDRNISGIFGRDHISPYRFGHGPPMDNVPN